MNPNHEMFQNWQQQQGANKPVGLENTGNTCYFSALIQCLYSLPIFVESLTTDHASTQNENSFVCKLNTLLHAIDDKESGNNLRKLTLNVLHDVRQRFGEEFEAGKQADPQELYLSMKMMLDEQLGMPNQIALMRNHPNQESFIENYEFCNRSKITKISTIYNKVVNI